MGAADQARLETEGCVRREGAMDGDILDGLAQAVGDVHAGARVSLKNPVLEAVIMQMSAIISDYLPAARPVRAVWFDKTAAANWAVPWHQDRTIAVRNRVANPGFGPWSIKAGTVHVEPPFALLANMLTMRLHIDACPAENAPLEVAIGSHGHKHPIAEVTAVAAASPRRLCLAAKGDLWLYRTPIVHRSARAERPARRRVLQIDFCGENLPQGLEWAE